MDEFNLVLLYMLVPAVLPAVAAVFAWRRFVWLFPWFESGWPEIAVGALVLSTLFGLLVTAALLGLMLSTGGGGVHGWGKVVPAILAIGVAPLLAVGALLIWRALSERPPGSFAPQESAPRAARILGGVILAAPCVVVLSGYGPGLLALVIGVIAYRGRHPQARS